MKVTPVLVRQDRKGDLQGLSRTNLTRLDRRWLAWHNEGMAYQTTIRDERYRFADLQEVFAKANEEKSGDRLGGIAAGSERERVAAKRVLADVRLEEIAAQPLVDADDVTRLLWDTHDQQAFRSIRSLTVGEFREY